MQGLFTGPGVNDVYARQRQERDQKVRQAMADSAGAGGNFYANLQAKANEQMSQAFQGGVRGLLQGTDLAPAEDPRLAAARKRETDKTEIMDMLSGYNEDGKISEDELRKGYSELMSRGYPQEAASFLQQAQSMRKLDIDATKAITSAQAAATAARYGLKSTDKIGEFEDTNGRKFNKYVKFNKDNTQETVVIPWDGDSNKPAEGELSPLGPKGLTPEGRIEEAGDTSAATEIPKRGTAQFKELLTRKTNELKSNLNVTEDKAKKWADKALQTRESTLGNATVAQQGVGSLRSLLALARARTQGGDINSAYQALKRSFGKESQPDAEFRTGSQMLMIKNLKRLFGAKATDKDFEELAKAFAQDAQPSAANVAILENMLEEYEDSISMGTYFANNPEADSASFFTFLKERDSSGSDNIQEEWDAVTGPAGAPST